MHDLAGSAQWRQLGVDDELVIARLVRERAALLTKRKRPPLPQ